MDAQQRIAQAADLLPSSVAHEVAAAYDDIVVFPDEVQVDRASDDETAFPGWDGDVLVLAEENQGVCTWGLALDGPSAGSVVVGGDLAVGETTVIYAESLAAFVAGRHWDLVCLTTEPLLQAQAEALDDVALAAITDVGRELAPTHGWPCAVGRRFEVGVVRVMLWVDPEACDWWIAGPLDEVRSLLPMLRTLSDLRTSLWSNDGVGTALLEER